MKFIMIRDNRKIADLILNRFIWLLFLVFIFSIAENSGLASRISAEPYPVGGVVIDREDLTSASFRLKITNNDLHPPENNRTISRTWLIAGARGRVPTYTVESAAFAMVADGSETTRTTSVPDVLAQNFIRVADMGLLRQYWTYNFSIVTASPSGEKRFWVLTDAVIKIDLGEPVTAIDSVVAERWHPRFGEDSLLGSQLLNANVGTEYYAMDYNDPVDAWLSWTDRVKRASSSGNMFRFRLYDGGIYRIDKNTLDSATSGSITTPVSQWKVFKDGQEVKVYAAPGIPDALFLPVANASDDGLRNETYWVDTSGSDIEKIPLRLTAPTGDGNYLSEGSTTSAQFMISNRELNEYIPSHNATPGIDRWFWTEVTNRVPAMLNLKIPEYYDPVPESKLSVSIRYSFTNFPPILPKLQLYAGGKEVGETSLTLHQGVATMYVDATALQPGDNDLAAVLVYPPAAQSYRPVSLQAIETIWTQQIPKPNSALITFSEGETHSTGTRVVVLEGVPGGSDVAIGFRDKEPVLLPLLESKIVLDGQPYASIFLCNLALASKVAKAERINSSFNLSEIKSARSIIISAAALTSGSQRLKQMQEARGLSTVVYSVADLYDAFSYGSPNSNGIRSALRYLFNRATGEAPEYVTLVGEASDFRGNPLLVPEGTQDEMVPASTAATPNAPQGDNLYAAAIGSDLVGDFIVGRIPAPNEKELNDYLNKVQEFEAAPVGDWARIAEFAMDDNDEFPEVVSHILEEGLAPQIESRLLRQWDYEYVPNLRVPGVKRSWGSTDRILQVFNEGVGVLNFFGHGGPNLWSHERMLHLSDLPKIQNGTMLPLITCASCDSAWISYPTLPVKASMGEKLVLKADGGAVGLFGPVAGASPYEHETLVRSLMEGLSRVQLRNIGDLVFYAKNQYYTITRSASIVDQYLLLGDPTVGLPIPKVKSGLNVELTKNPAGKNQVHVTLADISTLEADGTLTLSASANEDALKLAFGKGISQWHALLPANFSGKSVKALLETNSQEGPKLFGTTFMVDGENAPKKDPEILSVLGNQYVVWPDSTNPVSGTPASRSFKYAIIAADGATTNVRVVASINGIKAGEVSEVKIEKSEAHTLFDLNLTSAISPPADAVTLEVIPNIDENSVALTTVTLRYPDSAPPELELVPGTARAYSKVGDFTAQATVFIEADLRNSGDTIASNVGLQALLDNPTTGSELKTINDMTSMRIGEIAPGEVKKVTFRWENPTLGVHGNIHLVVNRNKVVRETTFDNNSLLVPEFTVNDSGNFTISSFDVTPRYTQPGMPVKVDAVMQYQNPGVEMPVMFELLWNRSADGKTSSTRFPVQFADGWATVSTELITPAGFDHITAKINSDLEIEESNSGDNSITKNNIVVYMLPDTSSRAAIVLDESLKHGSVFNMVPTGVGVLRVSPDLTSSTDLLIADKHNVTTGSISGVHAGPEKAWVVSPWRIVAEADSDAGPIEFKLPMDSFSHEIPGNLFGYFISNNNESPSVEVRFTEEDKWMLTTASKPHGGRLEALFGEVMMKDNAITWQMRPTASRPQITLEYLRFLPNATEWISPPYRVPEALKGALTFQVGTPDKSAWKNVYIDWRTGSKKDDGDLSWKAWNSCKDCWQADLTSEEYLQVRVLGVPVSGTKPYLEDFRLIPQ